MMLCPVSSAFSTLWPRTPTSVQLDGRADLARQPSKMIRPGVRTLLPHLKEWIFQARQAGGPFMIIGDFNRRLDVESPDVKPTDMWDVITGASTSSAADDVRLRMCQ